MLSSPQNEKPGAEDGRTVVRPHALGTDIGIVDRIGDVQIGLHGVWRKLKGEAAILHLNVLVDRPAASVVGKLVLENDFRCLRRPL